MSCCVTCVQVLAMSNLLLLCGGGVIKTWRSSPAYRHSAYKHKTQHVSMRTENTNASALQGSVPAFLW